MKSNRFFTKLWERYTHRPDSEHEQALVRVMVSVLIFTYLLTFRNSALISPTDWNTCFRIWAIGFPLGVLVVVAILFNPRISHPRRIFGMLIDYVGTGALLLVGGEFTSPFYFLTVWVTVGNGLRFGIHYLYLACFFSLVELNAVLIWSNFWSSHLTLGLGLLCGAVAVPLYAVSLQKVLIQAKEAALQASAAKTRFLATMSHELRTPLNGIINMNELLASTKLTSEQAEYVQVNQSASHNLLWLVNKVLDIAAIEAGKLKRDSQPFALSDMVQNISIMLRPSAIRKGLDFNVSMEKEVPARLIGDPGHLRQILVNLLHNAVKFTEKGSVSLRISNIPHDNEETWLRFEIIDTGPGIPDDAKLRIFEPFEQVDTGFARAHGGTGLGTTIAKTLTHLLGGRIILEDNPAGGTRFIVELPFKSTPEATFAQSIQLKTSNVIAFDDPFVRHRSRVAPLRVLVADDQPANQLVFQRVLEKAGHHCFTVNDGEELLDRLAEESFDVVLVDLHMPKLSGIDAVKQLRMMEPIGPPTPFIAISADVTLETIELARKAGITDFLPKPLVVKELLDRLAAISQTTKQEKNPPEIHNKVYGFSTLSSTTEVIDKSMLGEMFSIGLGGNFVEALIKETLADMAHNLQRAHHALATADTNELREASHALKGIAINIGAMKLAHTCCERAHIGKDKKSLRAYVNTLEVLIQEIHQYLPVVVKELQASIIPGETGSLDHLPH